jgi:hypothetical protein
LKNKKQAFRSTVINKLKSSLSESTLLRRRLVSKILLECVVDTAKAQGLDTSSTSTMTKSSTSSALCYAGILSTPPDTLCLPVTSQEASKP